MVDDHDADAIAVRERAESVMERTGAGPARHRRRCGAGPAPSVTGKSWGLVRCSSGPGGVKTVESGAVSMPRTWRVFSVPADAGLGDRGKMLGQALPVQPCRRAAGVAGFGGTGGEGRGGARPKVSAPVAVARRCGSWESPEVSEVVEQDVPARQYLVLKYMCQSGPESVS
jgi:hypothetical protein